MTVLGAVGGTGRERGLSLSRDAHRLVGKRGMQDESKSGPWDNPQLVLNWQREGGDFQQEN